MRIDENGPLFVRVVNEDPPAGTAPPTNEGLVAHDSNFQRFNPSSAFPSGEPAEGFDLQRSQASTGEARQWSIHKDHKNKTYYLNCVTGEKQYKKPDCLKKFDPRHSGSCVIM